MLVGSSPSNNDSTLQAEAVLIVVIRTDRVGAAIAKASVEVFELRGTQREFLIYFDVKTAANCHAKSSLGITGSAASCIAVAAERGANATKVEFEKRPEGTAVSEGNPRAEQESEFAAGNFVAQRGVRREEAEYLASTHVRSQANHAGKVVGDCAATTGAVNRLCVSWGNRTDKHESRRCFNLRELAVLSEGRTGTYQQQAH